MTTRSKQEQRGHGGYDDGGGPGGPGGGRGGGTGGLGGRNDGPNEVRGQIVDERGVAARGVLVQALDHGLRGAQPVGEAITDDTGAYVIRYAPVQKATADLQIRALDTGSPVIYDARTAETVHLVVPSGQVPRETEYERLIAALAPRLDGLELGELSAEAINYLSRKSGWDPRSIAMAAQAAQLARQSNIPAAHYYALFRSGAANDELGLTRLSTGFVQQALTRAAVDRLIPDVGSIEKTVELHRAQTAEALQVVRPRGAVSTLGDMLALRLDPEARSRFIGHYQLHSHDPDQLWSALAGDGFKPETIAALQTDGKLGYLTQHNAKLVARLRDQSGITDASELALAGLYRAAAWKDLIGDELPEGVSREAYAAGLAAQVNLSYPTLVAAEMVRRREIALPGVRLRPPIEHGEHADHEAMLAAADPSSEIADFLTAGHVEHKIGATPVKTWQGYSALSPAAKLGVRGVERMYQISPSNESLIALSQRGLHSAYTVVQDPLPTFLARHGGAFPSVTEAEQVYAKAQAVNATTLNVATAYLAQRAAPNVYATTGDLEKQPGGPVGDVPGAPTLEELFDNLDYCACDHCRSVLSPAAYLVELLEFIDLPPEALLGGANPIAELRARRPDLEHLQLSCENTNVALPYLDLVNEVLEFWVVNPSFTGFRQRDLGSDAISADLLADPQFIEATAYDKTKAEVYPWGLPFDMPLEAMRLILQSCDTTLAAALRRLGDAAGARRERLGLDAGESSILTSLAFRALPEYFGLPAATTISALNDQVADGKAFCRRTEISYEDLVAILRTRFVNPGIDLVAPLERLQVAMTALAQWYAGAITDAALLALVPAGLDLTDYGGDVLTWLTGHQALILGLITLTDTSDPDAPSECNFAQLELRFAAPDMTANRLTALAYHKLLRFLRLWKQLGWTIELTDQVVTALLPTPPAALTETNLDAAFRTLLARIANLLLLLDDLGVSPAKLADWLPVWDAAATRDERLRRLAGLLHIGTIDLDELATLSGLDPLAADLEADAPSLIQLAARRRELAAVGVKLADLGYLLRHADASGALAPSEPALLRALKALRDGLTAADAELTLAPDNADLAIAKAKLALVYDARIVDWLFALAGDTTSYAAPLAMAEEVLPAPLAAVDPRVSYDPFAHQLGFRGLVPAGVHAALDAAAGALVLGDVETIATQPDLDAFKLAFKAAVQALVDAGAADLAALDAAYPELKAACDAMRAAATPAAGVRALLDAVLPALRGQLRRLALRTQLASVIPADPDLVDALTSGPGVLHADGDAGRGVLDDFDRLDTAAVWNADGNHAAYLDPPASDDYRLYVAAPAGTQVTLSVAGTIAIPTTAVGGSGELATTGQVALSAGALTRIDLTLAGLPAGTRATLRWRTKGMAKAEVPAVRIYDRGRALAARASLIRLQNSAALVRMLDLTPRELTHFAAIDPGTRGVLDALDVAGGISAPDLHAQFARIAQLAWFAARKQDQPDDDAWLAILSDPARTDAHGDLAILGLGGWKAADLTAVLTRTGLVQGDLAQLAHLRTVSELLDAVIAADYPAADFLAWANAAPGATELAAARAAIRARLDDAAWRDTMKSVNDALRNQRRDALVRYILHHNPPTTAIDTADKLYEYFLIDVQMDACMQTSRIRQALSTVQLFITRCFMNLEPAVKPGALRADRWDYMKRYRVWEANRKIFLYPENWLEPELRDNKSPLFRDLEGALMKADITDELAETAFLDYLQGLDHIARLEICGSTIEQRTPGDPTDDVLHVFGRTHGKTREHYYRRYEGGYWLPWQKVALDIQGDHVVPAVWKGRLFVFWLEILEKAEPVGDKSPEDMRTQKWHESARKTAEIQLAWGEYYQGKWTSPKSTHTGDPMTITGLVSFEPRRLVLATRTEQPDPPVSERLILDLVYWHDDHSKGFKVTFTSVHAPPIVGQLNIFELLLGVEAFNYALFWQAMPDGALAHDSLRVPSSTLKVNIAQPEGASATVVGETLLSKTGKLFPGFRVRPTLAATENRWEAPFFYYDEHSTFFVKPDEAVVMVSQYHWYYVELPPPKLVVIPPIYEVPVEIPIPIPDPIGPVILPPILHPIDGMARGINPAAQFVLPNNTPFAYGGATFDARGIVQEVTR